MEKRYILPYFIIFIFLLSGCKQTKKNPEKMQMKLPVVSYILIKKQRVTLIKELPGRVASYKSAKIIPQVSGTIMRRVFKEGSYVKKGELLYIIDPRPYEAALESAQAALKAAEANVPSLSKKVKRYSVLVKTNSISKQVYDDTKAALDKLKANIELYKAQIKSAKINLDYCYIKAPIDGIIGRSYITEGQVVYAYQPNPLAIIQHFDPVYVDVPISTKELYELKKKRKSKLLRFSPDMDKNVELIFEDNSIYPEKGVLEFNEVTVDKTTSSVILRIKFPNKNKVLLPQMFVRVRIIEGIMENGMLVPEEAIMFDTRGKPYVFVVDKQNRAVTNPVVIDRSIGNKWLVTSGLKENDRVIVKGLQFIRPGIPVKAVPNTPNTRR
ncbi:efflux RND transporter periplasmic adaptor subunit [Desulfothermus naphthae]